MPNKLAAFNEQAMVAAGKQPGWKLGDGDHLIGNSKLATHVSRVMVTDDKGAPVYDQVVRMEAGGAQFLPVDTEGKIGLQEMYRFQTKDPQAWSATYPNVDFGTLGRKSFEIPGGFAKPGEDLVKAGIREAQEETGSMVTKREVLGYYCGQKSFEPHMVLLMWGMIDPSKKPKDKPDPFENQISKIKFYTWHQVTGMMQEGLIYEGGTLAAIAFLIGKHPEVFAKTIMRSALLK